MSLVTNNGLQADVSLKTDYAPRTINDLVLLFEKRQINLDPGFQRNSVWTRTDRRRLIDSIFKQYPLPSVFLYKRKTDAGPAYDVIDGKQRPETIFRFMGLGKFKRDTFGAKLDLGGGLRLYDWRRINKEHPEVKNAFLSYRIQTAEVDGRLSEIVDLFVRINSTGKPLTSAEKRHTRFFESALLKAAEKLAREYRRYFVKSKIFTDAQLKRMRGVELMTELLVSIQRDEVINKKTALDRAIANDDIDSQTMKGLVQEVRRTMKVLQRMLPDIASTRFRNTADFYSLFMIVWKMRKEKLVLADRQRIRAAQRLLHELSRGVDELLEQMREARPRRRGVGDEQIFRDYLLTVKGDTDSAASVL